MSHVGYNTGRCDMSRLSEADQFLLDQIRAADESAWTQLVERHQGRLVAFAASRLPQRGDAEDLVQDTFVSFLGGLANFKGEASIETYLFTILRRKIIDAHRGRRLNACLLQDAYGNDSSSGDASGQVVAAPDPTVSWYVRRDEQRDIHREALAQALHDLVEGYRQSLNFRDLQIVEMLFYSQLRNKDVARQMELTEQHVAQIKHRCLKQIRENATTRLAEAGSQSGTALAEVLGEESMLTRVWEELRLSCPKRSTIGAFLLGTLDEAWRQYVDFHLNQLGCRYCRANLEDLQAQTAPDRRESFRQRIMESTVGFLKAGG